MKLIITALSPLFPKGNYVQWSITKGPTTPPITFDVYRSGGMEGPWEPIASGLTDQYAFVDDFTKTIKKTDDSRIRPNQLNQFRDFCYRIVAKDSGGEVAEAIDNSSPLSFGSIIDKKMLQIQRAAVLNFRRSLRFNGTEAVILKRRHWGTRCVCVDKGTKEALRSGCTKCWGTGITDGYWAPVVTAARKAPSSNSSAITPENKSDSNDIHFWLPDIPALEQDDVIVFLRENSRWRIDTVAQTQIRLQDTHQVVSGQAIDKSSIIYRIPVRLNQTKALF